MVSVWRRMSSSDRFRVCVGDVCAEGLSAGYLIRGSVASAFPIARPRIISTNSVTTSLILAGDSAPISLRCNSRRGLQSYSAEPVSRDPSIESSMPDGLRE